MGEVYRPRRQARARRRHQDPASPSPTIPIGSRASSARRSARRAQPSEHRARSTGSRNEPTARALVMELVEGRRSPSGSSAARSRSTTSAGHRAADRRRARGRHEQGIIHRDLKPANMKVRARRHGEGARLRPGEGDGAQRLAAPPGVRQLAHVHIAGGDPDRRDPRHGRLHGARAGPGIGGGGEVLEGHPVARGKCFRSR